MKRRLSVMPKTTEQNLIVSSGKSKAAVTNNRCIGDDTKAAARRSPNYIRKTKNTLCGTPVSIPLRNSVKKTASPHKISLTSTLGTLKITVRHIAILLPVSILTILPCSACHCALGCRISSKSVHHQRIYNVISIFKMAAAVAQYYFRFHI